jgi:hypothetical protein
MVTMSPLERSRRKRTEDSELGHRTMMKAGRRLIPFMIAMFCVNVDLLAAWVPDAAPRRRILVETPVALYGFPPVKA